MRSDYTLEERRADAVLHVLGVGFAVAACGWLIARLAGRAWSIDALVLSLYGVALVGVLTASAAYNLSTGPIKSLLRRLDHSMIFMMIGATYTPFLMLRLPAETAQPLGWVVWSGCLFGCLVKLLFPGRFDRLSVILYLALGWAVAWTLAPLEASLGPLSFMLLVAGGVFYTVGVGFHLMERLRFHNALWHACVLAGAIAHFAAIAAEFI